MAQEGLFKNADGWDFVEMLGPLPHIDCPFCGARVSPEPVTNQGYRVKKRADGLYFSSPNATDASWLMVMCTKCMQPMMYRVEDPIRTYPEQTPEPTKAPVPSHICEDANEAKVCFSVRAYKATVTMARRAMQAACLDQGATEKLLIQQINQLVAKQMLSPRLGSVAHAIRNVGNEGAHPESNQAESVSQQDAKDVLTLMDLLLTDIYVLGQFVSAHQTRTK